jgi:hypothetical protein
VNGLHLTATVTEQSVMWEEEILFLTLKSLTLQPERRAELFYQQVRLKVFGYKEKIQNS